MMIIVWYKEGAIWTHSNQKSHYHSSGEFVGMVADDPNNKIDLKAFHCEIINDHEALKREEENYKNIKVIRKLDNGMVQRNYLQVKQEIQDIIQSEMERLINDPMFVHLVIKKG